MSATIAYYSGKPQGYAGYTDYVAMMCVVNDDLRERSASDQFSLIGFGQGFVSVMIDRLTGRAAVPGIEFRVESTAPDDNLKIQWLSAMQQKGTDNAGPSTESLQTIIAEISSEITKFGPILMRYWEKRKSGDRESLDKSGIS